MSYLEDCPHCGRVLTWDFLQAAEWIASKRSSSAAPAITEIDWKNFDEAYEEMQQEKEASR